MHALIFFASSLFKFTTEEIANIFLSEKFFWNFMGVGRCKKWCILLRRNFFFRLPSSWFSFEKIVWPLESSEIRKIQRKNASRGQKVKKDILTVFSWFYSVWDSFWYLSSDIHDSWPFTWNESFDIPVTEQYLILLSSNGMQTLHLPARAIYRRSLIKVKSFLA